MSTSDGRKDPPTVVWVATGLFETVLAGAPFPGGPVKVVMVLDPLDLEEEGEEER
jgi:hypothetical protein